MAMSRSEELQLQRELKEVLREYTYFLHSVANPVNHGFDVIVCRHNLDQNLNDREHECNRSGEYIIVRAIVYTEPSKGKWKVLSECSKAQFGITPALQEFTKDLEREMGAVTASMNVGDVYGDVKNLLL